MLLMDLQKFDIIVVGAGLSGLVIAEHLFHLFQN